MAVEPYLGLHYLYPSLTHTHTHTYMHTHHTHHRYQHHWRLPSDDSTVIMRRYLLMAVCVVFFVTVAIVMLTRVGRGVADRDPSLDWRTNPNLKTGD